jgi:malonate decarboxylase delta subunit
MEKITLEIKSAEISAARPVKKYALAGVVTSNNLEVLMEPRDLGGVCRFEIVTSAEGFGPSWKAVAENFVSESKASNLLISINDNGASPSVVSLRLFQAHEDLTRGSES